MNRDNSKDSYRFPYSKTILYYIKTALIFFLLVFVPACAGDTTVTPDLSAVETVEDVNTAGSNVIASGAEKIEEVVTASRDVVNNNSLEWWQWIIIGMFIPTPWDIFTQMIGGFMKGFRLLFTGFK